MTTVRRFLLRLVHFFQPHRAESELERELAALQRELNRLQNMGDTGPALMDLLHQKTRMIRALEAMKPPKELQ